MSRKRSLGGVFTHVCPDRATRYSVRRGRRIIELCEDDQTSAGIVGEDIVIETETPAEALEHIQIDGRSLRFALIGQIGMTLMRLQNTESVPIVTSYPRAAEMLLKQLGINARIVFVQGCVEAELWPGSQFPAAIELVLSGESVRDNGLRVIEDYLRKLQLMKIGRGELL